MTEIEIGQRRFGAQITGKLRDGDWDYRESKSITLEADYETVLSLFQNGAAWAILVSGQPVEDPDTGEMVTPAPIRYDNSAFLVAGDITDHRDGTITVKMGRLTALEETLELIYGGDET